MESTYSICDSTQCPEKFICLHQECPPDIYCYECLNKKHLGKNNVLHHVEDFLEIDKFMQQVTSKCKIMEEFYQQMIDKCSMSQNIQDAQNQERSKVVGQKIQKEFQEFIDYIESEKQRLVSFQQYDKKEHENLKAIYFLNEQMEMKKLQDKQNQLEQKVEEILQSSYLNPELQQLKLEERSKALQFQYNKLKFYQQILAFCFLILILGFFYQQILIEQLNNKLRDHQSVVMESFSENTQFWVYNQNQFIEFQNQINFSYGNFTEKVGIQQEEIENRLIKLETPLQTEDYLNLQALIGEIHIKLDLKVLRKFTLIYDNAFTVPFHSNKKQKLEKIVFKNDIDPIICIGGLHQSNLNMFLLAGCDYASEVFQVTTSLDKARKSKNGGIFWYWVEGYSFGFTANAVINLGKYDIFDIDIDSCQTRFSYVLNSQWNGDGRIGTIHKLQQSVDYRMRIYMYQP